MDLSALLAPDTLLNSVIQVLLDEQVEAYLVGGSVRDALLARSVQSFHDLDFAVPWGGLALARRLANRLGGAFFALDADRDTGRVVLTGVDGRRRYLDFAQWRGDSLHADLADRDFTINAMALGITQEGAPLVDPFGGQDDLLAKVVRVVSKDSFAHDPVRVLRAARMEATFGFGIEPHTETLLRQAIPWLDRVSRERVRDELERIIAMPGAAAHVSRLDELGLLAVVLPKIVALKSVTQPPPHNIDVWGHTLRVLESLEGLFAWLWPDAGYRPLAGEAGRATVRLAPWRESWQEHLLQPASGDRLRLSLLKLAALLHDVGKPETHSQDEGGRIRFLGHEKRGAKIAAGVLRYLRFSKEEISLVQMIVAHHLRLLHLGRVKVVTRRAIYRFFRETGAAGVDLVLLGLADYLGTHGDLLPPAEWQRTLDAAAVLLEGYFDQRQKVVSPPGLINGRDLMAKFDLAPGPRLGELLARVREAQAEGRVSTREGALAFVQEMLDG